MKAPTERQLEILAFMRDHITAEGIPPTVREITSHFGFVSTNGTHEHLRALERQGLVERLHGQHGPGSTRARAWRPARSTALALGDLGLEHGEAPLATPTVTASDAIDVGDFLRAMARLSPVHVRSAMLRVGAQLSSAGQLAKAGVS